MKRSRLLVTVTFICMAFVSVSFAEEPEGLIPRLMKKFKGTGKTPASIPALPKQMAPQVPGKTVSSGTAGERTVTPGLDKMTKEELIKDIKEGIESEDEILSYIPQLKMTKDPDGKVIITFEKDGQKVKLEDLDRETLAKIWGSINQIATKINVDRINQQLETIRQTQALQRVTRPPQAMVPPPQPPRYLTPAPAPQAPPAVPTQASRAPQPPPQPPRR